MSEIHERHRVTISALQRERLRAAMQRIGAIDSSGQGPPGWTEGQSICLLCLAHPAVPHSH